MRFALAAAAAVSACLGIGRGALAQVPPPPQKQVMTFPLAVAPAQPAPSVECSVGAGPTVPAAALAFRPDGKAVASAGYQEVLLWDLAGAKLARRIGAGQLAETVAALAFHKDGKLLAVGDGAPHRAGGVKVFDSESGQLLAAFAEPKEVVYGLAFSPDGNLLAAGSADNHVYVWSLADKKLAATLKEHAGWVMHVAYSGDGKLLVSSGADRRACVWEVGSWRPLARLQQVEPVLASAFSPPADLVAMAICGPTDRAIRFRRRDNGEQVRAFDTGAAGPLGILWAPQNNRLYIPCTDGTVRVHDAGGGHIATLAGHAGWVHAVALSGDASRLVSGDAGGAVRVWNTADHTLLATLVQLTPRSDEWLIATAGYLATSTPAALQWKAANIKTPADKLPGIFLNPDLVQKTLAGAKPPPAAVP